MNNINYFNTPIHRLSESVNDNSFYIKRDDLIPFSFGGNKVRKGFLFFEDLKKSNCNCVVTYGSKASNHCRIIANLAALEKIPCHIISPREDKGINFNNRMVEMFDAHVTLCSVEEVASTIENKIQKLNNQGYRPYFIQGGGHGNIGTESYIRAYKEILEYEKREDLYFDYVFHTSGTGSTQAGLICGKYLNKDQKEIIGISNARKNPYGGQVVLDSVNEYLEIPAKSSTMEKEVNFIDDFVLSGYGDYNDEVLKTIKKIMIDDGVPMDSTYTGKAFWGMKNYIMNESIFNKNILFLHTGGTPLYFNDLEWL